MSRKVIFLFLIIVLDCIMSMEIPAENRTVKEETPEAISKQTPAKRDGDDDHTESSFHLFNVENDAFRPPDDDPTDDDDDDDDDDRFHHIAAQPEAETEGQAKVTAYTTEINIADLILQGVVETIAETENVTSGTTTATTTETATATPFVLPSEDCGPQGCRSNGEIVCGEYNYKHRAFSGLCDLKAYNCETGEKYEVVDISLCPRITYTYCPETEDFVCATSDNENFIVFKNFCEYAKFQSTSRKVYWTTPLSNCFHIPEMPIEKCYESGEHTSGEVCGWNGEETYKMFSDLFELTQEKCYEDGDWRKVSLIYC